MNHGCPNRHKCHSECTQDWWCKDLFVSSSVVEETGDDSHKPVAKAIYVAFHRPAEHGSTKIGTNIPNLGIRKVA